MKFMWPQLAAIFFMTYLYRAGGGAWPPRHPSGSATASTIQESQRNSVYWWIEDGRRGCANFLFGKIFAENCIKMKEFRSKGTRS